MVGKEAGHGNTWTRENTSDCQVAASERKKRIPEHHGRKFSLAKEIKKTFSPPGEKK